MCVGPFLKTTTLSHMSESWNVGISYWAPSVSVLRCTRCGDTHRTLQGASLADAKTPRLPVLPWPTRSTLVWWRSGTTAAGYVQEMTRHAGFHTSWLTAPVSWVTLHCRLDSVLRFLCVSSPDAKNTFCFHLWRPLVIRQRVLKCSEALSLMLHLISSTVFSVFSVCVAINRRWVGLMAMQYEEGPPCTSHLSSTEQTVRITGTNALIRLICEALCGIMNVSTSVKY